MQAHSATATTRLTSMQPTVTIRSSPIEGTGIFAAVNFAAGDLILTIDDSYVIDAGHPVPPGEENHCDFLECGKAIWMQAPERHINHCCDPNVFIRTVDGVRQLIARKQIRAGDEIAYDYCVNGYGDTVWTCNCGSARCRRTIHSDFFHLPVNIQLEYLPLLDTWFRRERSRELELLQSSQAQG